MTGAIVRSLAGHDKGEAFCVVRLEEPYLLLCDGKRRRQENPKRKKRIHVSPAQEFDHPTLQKLARQEPVTDKDIRKALAAFRAKEV